MIILKSAIFCFILTIGANAYSENYDLARLTTKTGKVYREIQILDADKHGLLFRHSNGIAKESFHFLSTNICDMFEPVEDTPAAIEITDKGGLPTDKGGIVDQQSVAPDLILTVRVRTRTNYQNGAFCRMHPNPHNWPSHWHRFHPAHYLTNPICRAQATENFLQATGLLPRPCGAIFHHSAGPNGRPTALRFW